MLISSSRLLSEESVKGCPDGYECHEKGTGHWYDRDALVKIAEKMTALSSENNRLRKQQISHFGWCAGGGLSLYYDFPDSQIGFAPSANVTYGWRF